MRISDWSSDVCSSDLGLREGPRSGGLAGIDAARAFDRRPAAAARHLQARQQESAHLSDPRGAGGTALSGAAHRCPGALAPDRKSVVQGKSVSVRVDLGGRRTNKKQKENYSVRHIFQKITTKQIT